MIRVDWLFPTLTAAGCLTFGCTSPVALDNRGEEFAVVEEAAESPCANPTEEFDAAVVWMSWNSEDNGSVAPDVNALPAERLRVTGAFPASFTFEPPTPPRVEADLATGLIAAIPRSAGDTVARKQLAGVSVDLEVVYFSRDADPHLATDRVQQYASLINIPATAGFHLVRRNITEDAERALFRCMHPFLCVHDIFKGPDMAYDAELYDQEFELCRKYVPEAPACTITDPDPDPVTGLPRAPLTWEEEFESARCQALYAAAQRRTLELPPEQQHCASPYTHHPIDFQDPVSVTLGASALDWEMPRTPDL